MTSCRSDLVRAVKETLTMEQVARHYGFEPSRSGFIKCPFHQGDRTASLKLYPGARGWYCFGCCRKGSVIDFVMELYGLTFSQAVVRLDSDLGLGLTRRRPSPAARAKALEERRKIAQEAQRDRERYRILAREHLRLREAAVQRAPTLGSWERGQIDPVYVEAMRRLPGLEHACETLSEKMMEDRR